MDRPNREQLADTILDLLMRGAFPAGRPFSEVDLLKTLQGLDSQEPPLKSRTPVREAVLLLVRDQLLDQIPQVGLSIHIPSEIEMRRELDMRSALECLVVRALVAPTLDQSERHNILAGLRSILSEMTAAAESDDVLAFADADTAFHVSMAQNARYSNAAGEIETIRARVRLARLQGRLDRLTMEDVVREHEDIVLAIEERDSAKAESLVKRHMEQTRRRLYTPREAIDRVLEIHQCIEQALSFRRRDADLAQATRLLTRARDLARDAGRTDLECSALIELTTTRRYRDDLLNAETYCQQALALAESLNDIALIARAHYENGRIGLSATAQNARFGRADDLTLALEEWGSAGAGHEARLAWTLYALAERSFASRQASDPAGAVELIQVAIDHVGRSFELFDATKDAYGASNAAQRLGLYRRELSRLSSGAKKRHLLEAAFESATLAYDRARANGFLRVEARAWFDLKVISLIGTGSSQEVMREIALEAESRFLHLDDPTGMRRSREFAEQAT